MTSTVFGTVPYQPETRHGDRGPEHPARTREPLRDMATRFLELSRIGTDVSKNIAGVTRSRQVGCGREDQPTRSTPLPDLTVNRDRR